MMVAPSDHAWTVAAKRRGVWGVLIMHHDDSEIFLTADEARKLANYLGVAARVADGQHPAQVPE